jgi:hypothetical protein
MKKFVGAAVAALGFVAMSAAAGSASAAVTMPEIALACDVGQVTGATACSGWYKGNLLNNKNWDKQVQALTDMGFDTTGLTWQLVDQTKIGRIGDHDYDFDALLNGETWIAIHRGNGGIKGSEGTGFFKLNADNLDLITLSLKGGSDAVLYSTGSIPSAVPEPATWAMMIVGFGLAGAAMRRRREAPALA